jgi:hypothetical protein
LADIDGLIGFGKFSVSQSAKSQPGTLSGHDRLPREDAMKIGVRNGLVKLVLTRQAETSAHRRNHCAGSSAD